MSWRTNHLKIRVLLIFITFRYIGGLTSFLLVIGVFIHFSNSGLGGSVSNSSLLWDSNRLLFFFKNSAAVAIEYFFFDAASNMDFESSRQFASLRRWCSKIVVETF